MYPKLSRISRQLDGNIGITNHKYAPPYLLTLEINIKMCYTLLKGSDHMKIAICEDEKLFAERLTKSVTDFFAEKDIGTESQHYISGTELLNTIDTENCGYDAIFMDINLGGKEDGMVLTSKLRELCVTVPVIFVTSLENRAVDGYDVGAFGFVVKKNLDEKLPKVLTKLWKELYCKRTVAITGKDFTEIIGTDFIINAQSQGRGTLIHTPERNYEDTRAIGQFAELLGTEEFVEAHKSVFVNISKIKRINTDTVVMCDDTCVPLSRRNRKNVMFAVMKRLGGK